MFFFFFLAKIKRFGLVVFSAAMVLCDDVRNTQRASEGGNGMRLQPYRFKHRRGVSLQS